MTQRTKRLKPAVHVDIARRRMHAQHLWGPPLKAPEDVVRWMGAMQAQEFGFAKWSIGQRARGVDDSAVQEAFDEGRILRTHLLRPTWHFVLPEDIRLLLTATAPRVEAGNAHRYRQLGLDGKELAKSEAVMAKCLDGGVHLTRKELGAELERGRISTEGQRLPHMLMHAELAGVISSGAMKGKQHTYALLDERAPRRKAIGREEAVTELTRRYFTSRGPATLKDYAWWSSLTTPERRQGLDAVAAELRDEDVDGRKYWFAASRRPRSPVSPVIDLVQIYDEIGIAYSESRDVLLTATNRTSLWESPMSHLILLDGWLIGHWKAKRKRDAVEIAASFDGSLRRAERDAFDRAIDRYGRFLGVPTTRSEV